MLTVGASYGLGSDLLVGKMWNVGTVARMFHGDSTNIAVTVKVEERVLVEVFSFGDLDSTKFNV
jgi:hypothetical protein